MVRLCPKLPRGRLAHGPRPTAPQRFPLDAFMEDVLHAGLELGSEPAAVIVRPLPVEPSPVCLVLLGTF